jgi:hypothetical protein
MWLLDKKIVFVPHLMHGYIVTVLFELCPGEH